MYLLRFIDGSLHLLCVVCRSCVRVVRIVCVFICGETRSKKRYEGQNRQQQILFSGIIKIEPTSISVILSQCDYSTQSESMKLNYLLCVHLVWYGIDVSGFGCVKPNIFHVFSGTMRYATIDSCCAYNIIRTTFRKVRIVSSVCPFDRAETMINMRKRDALLIR